MVTSKDMRQAVLSGETSARGAFLSRDPGRLEASMGARAVKRAFDRRPAGQGMGLYRGDEKHNKIKRSKHARKKVNCEPLPTNRVDTVTALPDFPCRLCSLTSIVGRCRSHRLPASWQRW